MRHLTGQGSQDTDEGPKVSVDLLDLQILIDPTLDKDHQEARQDAQQKSMLGRINGLTIGSIADTGYLEPEVGQRQET
jgi:hypothetical protein